MNYLEEILVHKRKEVEAKKTSGLKKQLEAKIEAAPRTRDFMTALCDEEISLIAEIKKASPSAGVIREAFDPVQIAKTYEKAGAKCLSVLTDERFFQGKLDDLTTVHQHTDIPCLQKDFIVDEIQLYESRATGADAILLIVAALEEEELRFLFERARRLGLHVLIETHNDAELDRAIRLEAPIIGINNRDLTTMKTSLNTTARLIAKIPDHCVAVSESGIKTREDVQMLKMLGVDAVLVGESLLKQPDLEAAVRTLMGTKVLTD